MKGALQYAYAGAFARDARHGFAVVTHAVASGAATSAVERRPALYLDGAFSKWTGKKMDVSYPRTDLFLTRFGDRATHTSVHAQFVARNFPRPPAGVDLDDWR